MWPNAWARIVAANCSYLPEVYGGETRSGTRAARKAAMLIAMTTADTIDYVSDLDPSKRKTKTPRDPNDLSKGMIESWEIAEGATTFKLRGLDVFMMGVIYDNASSLQATEGSVSYGIQTKVNQTNIEAVRHGLIGFANFRNAKGDAVIYETQKAVVNGRPYDVVSDKVMNTMGIRLIQELAGKIKEISEVTPAEEKNFAAESLLSA